MKELEKMLKNDMKRMAKMMLPLWIVGGLFSLLATAGMIWFIFWCASQFFGS